MQLGLYQGKRASRGHAYFHVHHPASTTQERRNANPIRQHLLYGRVPTLRRGRLGHKHDGGAGGEESIDPGELEGIGRDYGEFNLRFLDPEHSALLVSNEKTQKRTSPIICDNLKTGLPSSPLRLGSTCLLAVWRSSPSQNTSASPVSGSSATFLFGPSCEAPGAQSVDERFWGGGTARCGSSEESPRRRLSRARRSCSSWARSDRKAEELDCAATAGAPMPWSASESEVSEMMEVVGDAGAFEAATARARSARNRASSPSSSSSFTTRRAEVEGGGRVEY